MASSSGPMAEYQWNLDLKETQACNRGNELIPKTLTSTKYTQKFDVLLRYKRTLSSYGFTSNSKWELFIKIDSSSLKKSISTVRFWVDGDWRDPEGPPRYEEMDNEFYLVWEGMQETVGYAWKTHDMDYAVVVAVDRTSLRRVRKSLVENLRHDEDTADFMLISTTDRSEHKCHRLVLSVSNDHFKTLIANNLDPETPKNSASYDFSGATLEILLDFFYFGEASIDDASFYEILDAATMMFIPELIKQCEIKLLNELTDENFMDTLATARRFDLLTLQFKAFAKAQGTPALEEMIESSQDIQLKFDYERFLG